MNLTDFKTIAIIQTAFIGDIALALYLAQNIKLLHPMCKLIFVTTPQAYQLVKLADCIDEIIIFDKRGNESGWKGIKSIVKQLKSFNTDLILSPHRSLRSTAIAFLTKANLSVGFDKNAFSWLYDRQVKYRNNIHEIERNDNLLSVFNDISSYSEMNVELKFDQNDIDFIDKYLQINNIRNFVTIAPGSVWATKRWKEHHFTELCQLLKSNGIDSILIGSEADRELCVRISKISNTISLAGETSIPQTLLLLKNSKLLVTNDSAPIHFGGLMNCPTVAIFGPTIQGFGFYPRGKNDIVIEKNDLKCRPCGIHGANKCPIKTHECMESISPNMVFAKIEELLSSIAT